MKENIFRYKVVQTRKGLLLIAKLKLLLDSITTENTQLWRLFPTLINYRCNKALVVKIFDPIALAKDKKKYRLARSVHFKNFKYIKGKVVEAYNFNGNLNLNCGGGIYYFLTMASALGYMMTYDSNCAYNNTLCRIIKHKWSGKIIPYSNKFYEHFYNNGKYQNMIQRT